MRILVLGRNPSKRNCDPNIPFQGASCYKRLLEWINHLSALDRTFILANCSQEVNAVFDRTCINNYALGLRNKCYKDQITCVIALGNDAAKVCEIAGIRYFKLPHPSGLNRITNNKRWVRKILLECDKWLSK